MGTLTNGKGTEEEGGEGGRMRLEDKTMGVGHVCQEKGEGGRGGDVEQC
jgi:hypothetical protein